MRWFSVRVAGYRFMKQFLSSNDVSLGWNVRIIYRHKGSKNELILQLCARRCCIHFIEVLSALWYGVGVPVVNDSTRLVPLCLLSFSANLLVLFSVMLVPTDHKNWCFLTHLKTISRCAFSGEKQKIQAMMYSFSFALLLNLCQSWLLLCFEFFVACW